MNKKLVSLFLSGLLALSPLYTANAYIIDKQETSLQLAKSVEFKNETIYTDKGNQNINMVSMDLNDPSVKLSLLYNKDGFVQRQTLSNMVKDDNDVIAALNADFFSMSTPSFSIGPMVDNGKVLSNPHYKLNEFATFMLDSNNNPIFTYLRPDCSIANDTANTAISVAAINKPSKNYANTVVYTSEYMKNTPGATNTYYDLCEVIVENNVVKEVRYGQPSTPIPQNGYAIIAAGNNGLTLSNSFHAGDSVRLDSAFTLDLNDINLAVGGGSILVKDGALYPISHTVSGKSQRSALGVTPDNKLILVAVDGRLKNAPGMSETELAKYMQSIGCKDAIAFDGGGSTEMIVNDEIVNTMASSERPILNGVAIKSTSDKGSFSSIQASLDKSFGYVNDKFKVRVSTFDQNMNPLQIPLESINFSASGIDGYWNNNVFTPTSGGSGAINVSYGGQTASIPIDVYNPTPSNISHVDILPNTGTNVAFLPDMSSNPDDLLSQMIKIKYEENIEQNTKNTVLISNNDLNFENNINTNKLDFKNYFSSKVIDNNLFMTVDTSTSTLYKTDGQLDFFKNTINNSNEKNIFLVLNSTTPMNVKSEINLFKKTLLNASKTKNVYVIYKGSSFESLSQGNLNLISIPDLKNTYKNDFYNDYRYLLVNISEDNICYTYKNIFE